MKLLSLLLFVGLFCSPTHAKHINFWNERDTRFNDFDANGILDIHDLIKTKLLNDFNINIDPKIFQEITWPNLRKQKTFYMYPWKNNTSNPSIAFCPTLNDYQSNNPILRVIATLIGYETQALYLATHQDHVLFIEEDLIKKIWFHKDHNVYKIPNDESIQREVTMFYWPPNPIKPFVKMHWQKIYTLKSASELTPDQNRGQLQDLFPTHDKRLGCVIK